MKSVFTHWFAVIILLITIPISLYSQPKSACLALISDTSAIEANPVKINGEFNFDYWIKSRIRGKWRDDELSPLKEREVYIDYFVNTADGSILLPEPSLQRLYTYLPVNLDSVLNDRRGKFTAMIRMSNGQVVWYAFDKINNIKRAITSQTNTTTHDVASRQKQMLERYLNSIQAILDGYTDLGDARHESWASDLVRRDRVWGGPDGLKQISGPWQYDRDSRVYRVTMQIANNPGIPRVATGKPLIGFISGIMKSNRSPCNLLVVETTIELTEDKIVNDELIGQHTLVNRGEYLQETITEIGEVHTSFDASGYKPAFLGSVPGTGMRAQMAVYEARIAKLEYDISQEKKKLNRCSIQLCVDRVQERIDRLEQDKKDLFCEVYHMTGVADAFEECR